MLERSALVSIVSPQTRVWGRRSERQYPKPGLEVATPRAHRAITRGCGDHSEKGGPKGGGGGVHRGSSLASLMAWQHSAAVLPLESARTHRAGGRRPSPPSRRPRDHLGGLRRNTSCGRMGEPARPGVRRGLEQPMAQEEGCRSSRTVGYRHAWLTSVVASHVELVTRRHRRCRPLALTAPPTHDPRKHLGRCERST